MFDDLIECSNNIQTEAGVSPVMFVSNAVLFPGCLIPIRVFESRYQMMLKDVLCGNRTFILSFHTEDLTQGMTGSLGLIIESRSTSFLVKPRCVPFIRVGSTTPYLFSQTLSVAMLTPVIFEAAPILYKLVSLIIF